VAALHGGSLDHAQSAAAGTVFTLAIPVVAAAPAALP
jgi:hypothetical protein